ERRARLLREAGARVTVLAPRFSEALARLAADDADIVLEKRPFADDDVGPYWLVVAATDDGAVNARVAAAAERAKRFCNVVDDAERSSFIMPAIVDRDPVTIAISSGGLSPVVARHVKGIIESLVPARIGALARLAGRWRARVRAAIPGLDARRRFLQALRAGPAAGRWRARVRAAIPDLDARRRFWQALVAGPAAEHCYAGRDADAERVLEHALGDHASARAAGAPAPTAGEAWLVGAGPGNPDLIT